MNIGADPFEVESIHEALFERVVATTRIYSQYQSLTGRKFDLAEKFDAAKYGDQYANSVLSTTERYLARAVAVVVL